MVRLGSARRHVNGVLLLYHRPAFFSDAATITDHIDAFSRYSRFPFFGVNTFAGSPSNLGALSFDAIVVHYSVFASGDGGYLLDEPYLRYLDEADDSYKVAFFQDEHQHCTRRFAFLDRYRFDCVYTCIEPRHFEATYGTYTSVPRLVNYAPAYVSPALVKEARRLAVPDAERTVDIGYRARPSAPYFGRGGLEKTQIGEQVNQRLGGGDLVLDISTSEEDRLYGEDWYRFIARCRGFLGSESGTSCVDLEDEVRLEYEALVAAGESPTIERLEQGALGRWDGKVPLRTCSSRHFEAAAFRSCQLMYEGHYSGALEPMRHYIPLHKDLSNFEQAIERFRDPDLRRELTDNAYTELIASGEWSYERFIEGFDRVLEEAGLPPAQGGAEIELIRGEVGRRPPLRWGMRMLGAAWLGLRRSHPSLWRILHLVSRPLVLPVQWLARLQKGRRAHVA